MSDKNEKLRDFILKFARFDNRFSLEGFSGSLMLLLLSFPSPFTYHLWKKKSFV